MTKILFIATHGTDDPTRATFPFMEAKGAIEAGYETGIILMMEAAPLIKDHIAAQVQGIGVPPLKELMDFLFARNVRISVCEPSGRALGVTEDDFAGKNSGFGTSVDANNAYAGYDRVVTF
ncbi:MAG: DsrE family protein [Desulfobacteraceae bacterium]|nr:DsrE family protein [Desulfobacteraceae bacterium]